MKHFNLAFDRVIGHEGGFQNDHNDRGNWTTGAIGKGENRGTKYGLSAMSYPTLDIKNITLGQAKAIYHNEWWSPLDMDKFNKAIAFQMFDAAINHGMSRATKFLQLAVGTKADGIIGPKTIQATYSADLNDVLLRFLAYRLEFFASLSTFDRYGRGWSKRVANNLLLAAEDN